MVFQHPLKKVRAQSVCNISVTRNNVPHFVMGKGWWVHNHSPFIRTMNDARMRKMGTSLTVIIVY